MNENIIIRIASREDLPVLEKHLGKKNIPWFHIKRINEYEKGEGVWLVAWKENIPVGYIQVKWTFPQEENTKHIKGTAYLEAAGVDEEFQGQRIGTMLIQEAEQLARKKGFKQIGMAVGSTDNPRARNLYERLGYKDWGRGEFVVSWEHLDENGNKSSESEVCIYLLKNL